ncbi:MAG: hypothetical protein NVS2B16_37000 [Chloroflexota bacterium]
MIAEPPTDTRPMDTYPTDTRPTVQDCVPDAPPVCAHRSRRFPLAMPSDGAHCPQCRGEWIAPDWQKRLSRGEVERMRLDLEILAVALDLRDGLITQQKARWELLELGHIATFLTEDPHD